MEQQAARSTWDGIGGWPLQEWNTDPESAPEQTLVLVTLRPDRVLEIARREPRHASSEHSQWAYGETGYTDSQSVLAWMRLPFPYGAE